MFLVRLAFLCLSVVHAWSMSEAIADSTDQEACFLLQGDSKRLSHGNEDEERDSGNSSKPEELTAASIVQVVEAEVTRDLHELEYELHAPASGPHSKIALAIVSMLGLGMCGIDRCCMGQIFIGCMKGMTFGGFGIWFLIDYVVIIINCLSSSYKLDTAAWYTSFTPSGVDTAFYIVLVWLVVKVLASCFGHRTAKHYSSKGLGSLKATLRAYQILGVSPWEFSAFDKDGDGCVSAAELKAGVARLSMPLSDEDVQQLIKMADKNGDGKLQVEELKEAFEKMGKA